jgi:hypothetical protein
VRRLFDFPDPVNETSARLVAAGVVAMSIAYLVTGTGWILALVVYGFAARAATGPTLSPLGQFVTRVATPVVERRSGRPGRSVSGPPKRFAQCVGLACSATAGLLVIAGAPGVASIVVVVLLIAASLEACFAICLGCVAYQAIWGCTDCDDIGDRLRQAIDAGVRSGR